MPSHILYNRLHSRLKQTYRKLAISIYLVNSTIIIKNEVLMVVCWNLGDTWNRDRSLSSNPFKAQTDITHILTNRYHTHSHKPISHTFSQTDITHILTNRYHTHSHKPISHTLSKTDITHIPANRYHTHSHKSISHTFSPTDITHILTNRYQTHSHKPISHIFSQIDITHILTNRYHTHSQKSISHIRRLSYLWKLHSVILKNKKMSYLPLFHRSSCLPSYCRAGTMLTWSC